MKKLIVIFAILALSFSEEKTECDERSLPYWGDGINGKLVGENPTLRHAYKEIQASESEITPNNGFITLRVNISKTGKLCDIETFQIDENYHKTTFNNGDLIKELKKIALLLTWERDLEVKTYHLIRFKIKNGRIEEIF